MRQLLRQLWRRRKDEDGYVLVMTAFLLLVLMLMAAFTIDVGLWYSRANQLQRAADAAALAGVTYMPDVAQAYAVAADAAAKNGFDSASVSVNVVPASVAGAPRQLKVTLTDSNVPTIFGGVVMDHITITRSATAEYVSQVPVGSPLNAIGTGAQAGYVPGGGTQGFYLAVAGFCTAKEDGDRFLARYDGNRTITGTVPSVYTCGPTGHPNPSQVVDNLEYNAQGYDYIVHVPCGNPDPSIACAAGTTAASNVQIQAYDPVFNPRDPQNAADTRPDLRLPPQDNAVWLPAPQGSVTVTTTYEIYNTNYTPNTPSAWTLVASRTFGSCILGTEPDCTYANTWANIFTITAGQPAGDWRVRVYTKAAEANSMGVNAFSLRAQNGAVWALCDARTDITCPGVAGDSNMAVLANVPTTAKFYLARFAPAVEFAGKQVQILLWDVGENADTIKILDNNGNPAPFQFQTWDPGINGYTSDNAIPIGSAVSSLDVGGACTSGTHILLPTPGWGPSTRYNQCKFNDRMVSILLNIPTSYGASGPLANDGWWQIEYDASLTLKDLSTWSVTLLGDPVHLVRG